MPRNRMIFKDLENCICDLKVAINRADKRDAAYRRLLKQKHDFLQKEVLAYVDSYDWLTKEEAKKKMRFIRTAKYDYPLIRKELNLTEDALKSFIKYASAKLKEKIGSDTIDRIMNGDEKTIYVGMAQFYVLKGDYSLDKLVLPVVMAKLPNANFDPFSLLDCKKELQFLYDYSQAGFNTRFESLSTEKLAFIRYIIEKDSPKFAIEKQKLAGLLNGNGSRGNFDTYFEGLAERNV